MPDDLKGTDALDHRFLLAIISILQRMHADLDLIGWFEQRGG